MTQRAVAQLIQIAATARLEIHGPNGRIVGNLPGPGGGQHEAPPMRRCSTCGLVRSTWHPDAGKHLPVHLGRNESDGRCPSCFRKQLLQEMYPRYRAAGWSHQKAMRHIRSLYRAQVRDEHRQDRQDAQAYRAYLRAGGAPYTATMAHKRLARSDVADRLYLIICQLEQASIERRDVVPTRDAHGRFTGSLGGGGVKYERELSHLKPAIWKFQYEAGKAAESGRNARERTALKKAYLEQVKWNGRTGIDALKAREKTLTERLNIHVRQLGPKQLRELQAVHGLYYSRSIGQRLPYDHPQTTPYTEYRRLTTDMKLIEEHVKRYNRQLAASYKAEGRTDKPPRITLTDRATKRALEQLSPQQRVRLVEGLDRRAAAARQQALRDRIQGQREREATQQQQHQQQVAAFEKARIEEVKQGEENARSFFGRDLTPEEFRQLTGAEAGDKIVITATPGETERFGISFDGVNRSSSMAFYYQDGKPVVYVGFAGNAFHKGNAQEVRTAASGRDILRSMQTLQSLHVAKVHATAGRNSDMNGYYTWARLGFTGDIPSHVLKSAQKRFGSGVTRVEQIMVLPGGSKWWKEHGDKFEATFDFTPGSHSMNVFTRLQKALGEERAILPTWYAIPKQEHRMWPNVEFSEDEDAALDRIWEELTQESEPEERAAQPDELPTPISITQNLRDIHSRLIQKPPTA